MARVENETSNKRCSYQARYFDRETPSFPIFQCLEKALDNDSLCEFHSSKSTISEADFTFRLIDKIKEGITSNKPILLIGYIFPHRFFMKAVIENKKNILYIGSSPVCHIENVSSIYLPNLKPEEHEAHISQPIYFTHAVFKKGLEITNFHFKFVDFDSVIFEDQVMIAGTLMEKGFFRQCAFKKFANYSITRIVEADFSESHFYENAKFTGAILYKASFIGTRFDSLANFADITSYDESNFSNITCNSEATFTGAQFLGLSYFHYSVFKERANFEGSIFLKRSNFANVVFEEGEKVTFNGSNLSMISFVRTDITRVKFGDVRWRDGSKVLDEEDLEWSLKPIVDWNYLRTHDIDNSDSLIGFLRHNGIVDDSEIIIQNQNEKTIRISKTENSKDISLGTITLIENDKAVMLEVGNFSYKLIPRDENEKLFYSLKINIQTVLAIYRNLRENYEYRLRYEEAGKFFLREMEIKRKYQETVNNDIRNYYRGYHVTIRSDFTKSLSLTGIYYNLARYGESILIPVVVGISVIIITTLLFALQLNPMDEFSLFKSDQFHQLSNRTQVGIAFDRSLTDFMPIFFGNSAYKIGTFDHLIKLLGGIFTFGFIAIALRRKFERKIRH